ncbi:MAG: putative zinc-binding protein [Victivallaceae bacterium]|nr:putative zinc-binding protein [Victivallaceae bacterium]
MSEKKSCACSSAPKLIFPCSGSADVGEITDRAARKLMRNGDGKMFCLAGIGGRVSGIIKSTASASKVLVIDGCPLSCAKNCMELAGFKNFEYINLAELGMQKGTSGITEGNIEKVACCGKEKLACQ